MTTHTPGPWHLLGTKAQIIGIAAAVDPGWGAIATVYASDILEGKANARLIVSAPALLEALEEIAGNAPVCNDPLLAVQEIARKAAQAAKGGD